ncbi:MAG: YdcF family protein [Cyanothece sp. SIO1E1]|nr:YdcF family protein [Cyanothece sp. SIO1E1]
MFLLLTRILLWLLLGRVLWFLLVKLIPTKSLAWFGGLVILAILALAYFDQPTSGLASSGWDLLSAPLKPLGLAMVLLVFALAQKDLELKKLTGKLVLASLLVLYLFSIPLIANPLVEQAEQALTRDRLLQQQICGNLCPVELTGVDPTTVGAIVVLGQRVTQAQSGQLRTFPINERVPLMDTALASRLAYAGELYQEEALPSALVIVSAGPTEREQDRTEDIDEEQEIRQLLAERVPPTQIVIESTGLNVHATAVRVREILEERGLSPEDTRVLIVAPATMIRRASLTFAQNDINIPVTARPSEFYRPLSSPNFVANGADETPVLERVGEVIQEVVKFPNIIPSVETLAMSTQVVKEYLTSIYYFLRGWLPDFNVTWRGNVDVPLPPPAETEPLITP